jgi:gluconate 2-dehydrogenase
MNHQVLVTTTTAAKSDIERVPADGLDLDVRGDTLGPDELTEALAGKDAYILGGVETVDASLLASAPDLKVVACLGVGYAGCIDVDAATRLGVAVTNAPGTNSRAVAELTIALILDATRRVTALANATKAGAWPSFRARGLTGATLGVLGMGTIGTRVAEIARTAFGMEIVYHSRRRKPWVDDRLGARRVTLPEVLRRADVLTLHASLTPKTGGIIGWEALDLMAEHAVIVNTSEPELIHAASLRMALERGRIAAAVMDGYYIEPVPSVADDPHGLLALPDDRFLVLPHTAAATADAFTSGLEVNVRSIRNLLTDGTDPNLVNPEFRRAPRWHL